jgi:hypothetical protein
MTGQPALFSLGYAGQVDTDWMVENFNPPCENWWVNWANLTGSTYLATPTDYGLALPVYILFPQTKFLFPPQKQK